ncbi:MULTISPECIES: hypothetical protein [Pseudoalteromonas]|jgi:chromosome segregation ATPase|uniref:hypothetical protein n=1 Tax=Pseudoalteromonas TaxID=53246 RepID=UPI0005640AC6|nr:MULTISPECIES: hypothetical protein [Pseudoalteromonas]MBL0688372.1 chromosome partitioning protein ParA [Pseudoalteromonas sp.]MDN3405172.1 chromosome partitioning protein ParA [Pseudoalteromonas sp. APC 3218]MDN3409519.1 chromosome partitioning protein ParA [Pseudoalteromonas sp. APC 3894]MDN3416805.1 chromosome partitioning protein ParA [Pseudoalteromonas sp. APC 3227]MDN3420502.1 chromosome partitioning protein ParA [Pseudoalteromonas sp. APC 3895]|tara:strand:- start:1282 stop:2082 length:801 start_codon:yes stop_codon:yes gene_type:complete
MPYAVFPPEVYHYIAINFGLLILAAWFYILLLILREFRAFALSMVKSNGTMDDATLAMCRESVDNAMSYVNDNRKTIAELISVQMLLQQQLTEVTSSTKDHVTEKEQQLIDDLNKKLKRSHQLIRKLKGDLDKSVEKLKVTRQKLYAQYDAVTVLQEEKDQLQADYEALKTASENSDKTSSTDTSSTPDQTRLLNTLNEYKRQIAEQDQLLQQLQLQTDGPESSEELDTLKQELEKTQYALKHLTKEKKFIEGRYLEMMKNSQKPS